MAKSKLMGKSGSMGKDIESRQGKVVGKPKTMSDNKNGKPIKGSPKMESKKVKS